MNYIQYQITMEGQDEDIIHHMLKTQITNGIISMTPTYKKYQKKLLSQIKHIVYFIEKNKNII